MSADDVAERFEARWTARTMGWAAPPPPPSDVAADAPMRIGQREPALVARRRAEGETPGAGDRIARAARAVGDAAAQAFSPQAVLDDMSAAFQGVDPARVERAIQAGALKPLRNIDGPQSEDDPLPEQVPGGTFGWRGKLYPRQFADPETGATLDVSTPDTISGRLSRLGRFLGATMYGDALGGAAAMGRRAVRGGDGAAAGASPAPAAGAAVAGGAR